MESIESDEPTASPLDEVTSKSEVSVMSLQTSLDSSGRLKINRQKPKGSMPTNTEELRSKLKVEATAWLMLASKLKNKQFLHGLTQQSFDFYVEYLLGSKCYRIEVPSSSGERTLLKPPWTVMINYEFEMRKHAVKTAYRENRPLKDLLEEVTKNSELKELYFTLLLLSQGSSQTPMTDQTSGNKLGRQHQILLLQGNPRAVETKEKARGQRRNLFFQGRRLSW